MSWGRTRQVIPGSGGGGSAVAQFQAAFPPAIYFVDKINGSDSNDGKSEETPWQTITKVNAGPAGGYIDGTWVMLHRFRPGGDFTDADLIPAVGKRLHFMAYGIGSDPNGKGRDQVAFVSACYNVTGTAPDWTSINGTLKGCWTTSNTFANSPARAVFNGGAGLPVNYGESIPLAGTQADCSIDLRGVVLNFDGQSPTISATRTASSAVLASTSIDLTGQGPTATFYNGAPISGTGIPASATIVSYTSTDITISSSAVTGSGSTALTLGAAFAVGDLIIGAASGAQARLSTQTDAGTTGTLYMTQWNGTAFQDNERVSTSAGAGWCAANGAGNAGDIWFRTLGHCWQINFVISDSRLPNAMSFNQGALVYRQPYPDACEFAGATAWYPTVSGTICTLIVNSGSATQSPSTVYGNAFGDLLISGLWFRSGTTVTVFNGSAVVPPSTTWNEILIGGRFAQGLHFSSSGACNYSTFNDIWFGGSTDGLLTSNEVGGGTPSVGITIENCAFKWLNGQPQIRQGNHNWSIRGGAFKETGVPTTSTKSALKIGAPTNTTEDVTGTEITLDSNGYGTDLSWAGEDAFSSQIRPGNTVYLNGVVAIQPGENAIDCKNFGHIHAENCWFGSGNASLGAGNGGGTFQSVDSVYLKNCKFIGRGTALKGSPATNATVIGCTIASYLSDAFQLNDTPTTGLRGGLWKVVSSLMVTSRPSSQNALKHTSSDVQVLQCTISARNKANNMAAFNQIPTTGELLMTATIQNSILHTTGFSTSSWVIGRGTVLAGVTAAAPNNVYFFEGSSTSSQGRPSSDGALLTEVLMDAGITCQLDFDGGTTILHAGNTLTGATSGASATIKILTTSGSSPSRLGTCYLNAWNGVPFLNNEVIADNNAAPGAAVANGLLTTPFVLTNGTLTDPTQNPLFTNPWSAAPAVEPTYGYIFGGGVEQSVGDYTINGNLWAITYNTGTLETMTATTATSITLSATSKDLLQYAGKQIAQLGASTMGIVSGTTLVSTATGTSGTIQPAATAAATGTVTVGFFQGEYLQIKRAGVVVANAYLRNDWAAGTMIVSGLTAAVQVGDTIEGARGGTVVTTSTSGNPLKLRNLIFTSQASNFTLLGQVLTGPAAASAILVNQQDAGTTGVLTVAWDTTSQDFATGTVTGATDGSVGIVGGTQTSAAYRSMPALQPPQDEDLAGTPWENIGGATFIDMTLSSGNRIKTTIAGNLWELRNSTDTGSGSGSFVSTLTGPWYVGMKFQTNQVVGLDGSVWTVATVDGGGKSLTTVETPPAVAATGGTSNAGVLVSLGYVSAGCLVVPAT